MMELIEEYLRQRNQEIVTQITMPQRRYADATDGRGNVVVRFDMGYDIPTTSLYDNRVRFDSRSEIQVRADMERIFHGAMRECVEVGNFDNLVNIMRALYEQEGYEFMDVETFEDVLTDSTQIRVRLRYGDMHYQYAMNLEHELSRRLRVNGRLSRGN